MENINHAKFDHHVLYCPDTEMSVSLPNISWATTESVGGSLGYFSTALLPVRVLAGNQEFVLAVLTGQWLEWWEWWVCDVSTPVSLGVSRLVWARPGPVSPLCAQLWSVRRWTHLCSGRSVWGGRREEEGVLVVWSVVWCCHCDHSVSLSVTPTARDPYQYLS